jgi:hypothetical protein
MVLLVTDLLVDPDSVMSALRGLRAAGHDVLVFHIMDPAEREFTLSGEAQFTDPESALAVAASAADVRAAYRATVAEVVAEWREAFAAMGAGYELVLTDQPYTVPLRRAFNIRQHRP